MILAKLFRDQKELTSLLEDFITRQAIDRILVVPISGREEEIEILERLPIFDSSEANKVLFRRERFRKIAGTKKNLFNTLISVYGARENAHFLEAFDNQITLDPLF